MGKASGRVVVVVADPSNESFQARLFPLSWKGTHVDPGAAVERAHQNSLTSL
jgi:hypothetical protein